jgi:hypothetical protein
LGLSIYKNGASADAAGLMPHLLAEIIGSGSFWANRPENEMGVAKPRKVFAARPFSSRLVRDRVTLATKKMITQSNYFSRKCQVDY